MDRLSIHATCFYLGEKAANLADRWGLGELSNTLDSRFQAGSGTARRHARDALGRAEAASRAWVVRCVRGWDAHAALGDEADGAAGEAAAAGEVAAAVPMEAEEEEAAEAGQRRRCRHCSRGRRHRWRWRPVGGGR